MSAIVLLNLVRTANLDPVKLIVILEAGIQSERLLQQGNEILHNEMDSLSIDHCVTQAEILVSLLRRLPRS
jgi:hypothetical protein